MSERERKALMETIMRYAETGKWIEEPIIGEDTSQTWVIPSRPAKEMSDE